MAVSNIDKIVAKEEARVFGGNPTVAEFFAEAEKKKIVIFQSFDVPEEGVQTCATVGLHEVNIGLVSMGKKLRVEIVGAIDKEVENYDSLIAALAFDIMDAKRCFPGFVIEDVISEFVPDSEMKHILLTNPSVWEDLETMELDDRLIAWLMAVPISESECEYARRNGTDALEDVLEENEADIWDIYRESVI